MYILCVSACACIGRRKGKSEKKRGMHKKKGTDVSETLPDVIVIYPAVARAPAL